MLPPINEKIIIPEGVKVELAGSLLKAKGPKGENEKSFHHPKIDIALQGGKEITVACNKPTKREKTAIYSLIAHMKNVLEGVKSGFVYKVKACSSHFPMSITVEKDEVVIKNFLGEKIPRKSKIMPGVKVKVDGSIITVEGVDKEKTSATAARIEQATRITHRDRRVFQDGCFLIEKSGKHVE
ncbi:50S ribosomal protein L6 [Candidatus Woesearchaeota archaeon]|nr:50S ribosomal protein L6 [Candidatus Woesearchaeota archaeon]